MRFEADLQTTTGALAAVVRDAQANVNDEVTLREFTAALRRDRVLAAIGKAASLFLDTPNWGRDAIAVLGQIGSAVDASRVYLFECYPSADNTPRARMRHEWVATGIDACPGTMIGDVQPSPEAIAHWATLQRGNVIQGKLASMLPADCGYFSRLADCSIAAVPIFAGRNWWGYVGFTDDTHNREWSAGLLDALQAAGAMLGAAIYRGLVDERLRESQESYRLLSEAAFEGVLIHDQGIVLDANPAIARMFGYSLDELRGQNLLDLMIAPESRDQIVARMRSPSEDCYEVEARRKDGVFITAEITARVTTYHGKPARVVTILDVTQRRENEAITHRLIEEQAARASAEALQQRAAFLAEASRVLGASLDYQSTLRSLATLAVPMLADFCTVDVVGGDNAIERVAVASVDPERERILWEITRWVRAGARMVEHLQRAFGGESMIVETVSEAMLAGSAIDEEHGHLLQILAPRSFIAVPLRIGGKVVGALTLYRTDSEHRYGDADLLFVEELALRAAYAFENARLFNAAQSATRARDQLLGVVAHDLRNPLSTMLMATDLVDETMAPEDPARRQLAMVRRAGTRMNRLIQDLLDAKRMENGQLTMDLNTADVAALLAEAADTLRPLATAKALELATEVSGDLPMVSADAARVQQVLSNLVGNAIKFTPRGGRITLRATQVGGDIRFGVMDTGMGMPAVQLPHVFDQFWQASPTDRRGIGLGLTIAKGIVEAHHGRIWAESTVGAGSEFLFTIPITRQSLH